MPCTEKPCSVIGNLGKHTTKRSAKWVDQQKAVELLVAATGFRSKQHGRSFPFNVTAKRSGDASATPGPATVSLPGLGGNVNVSQTAHRGALRELAKAFQDGAGAPQDMRLALELFRLASDAGDPEAQGHMGLRYSMGLDAAECWAADGIVSFGQPKPEEALLHYYFGAIGGDMASRMALGYRYLMGISVPRSCWTAASYYQPVGEEVSDLAAGSTQGTLGGSFAGSSPRGFATASADGEAGAGGDGTDAGSSDRGPAGSGGAASGGPGTPIEPGMAVTASASSAPSGSLPHVERIRLHLQAAAGGLRSERHREVVQYYQYSADKGNTEAQTAVGQVLNYGTHGVDRDHAAAMAYFKMAAASGDVDAMAHLGSMYANGYGAPRSYETAVEWWTRAARRHHGTAYFGLGYLYLTGRGVAQDFDKAFQYFSKAAEQVTADARADALFYMGVMHLRGYGVRRKSVQRALSYFTLAAHSGHSLAQYNAAVMHLAGKGTPRNCKPAVALLKALAEKGPLAAAVQLGHEHFFRGRYGMALLSYLRAADLGLEVAQSNAAWMLERGYVPGANASSLAFSLYKQSAAQDNVHSLLCMGDAYFYGRGVEQDWIRSAAIYYEAYQERSPEAMFNLGFMHEFGVGVPRDLHLAERFYNMARHTHAEAFLPVVLANAWLRVHGWWDKLRPHLPAALDGLWGSIFALHAPHTSLFGPWTARLQRLLPNVALFRAEVLLVRWVELSGLAGLGGALRSEDAGEGAMLLALMGGLLLVMWMRKRRAEARRAHMQAEAARLLELQRPVAPMVPPLAAHSLHRHGHRHTAAAGAAVGLQEEHRLGAAHERLVAGSGGAGDEVRAGGGGADGSGSAPRSASGHSVTEGEGASASAVVHGSGLAEVAQRQEDVSGSDGITAEVAGGGAAAE
ncbi:hypothetical protein GPECTOR_70g492 [Gonium pectorale]|uniref:Uncharacterized protein n=1 Tax=Gonium pectorale TaxID=33097 RepID=A0A150G393_GONPE|nr:hypothetical protein GPECTOR_70g492 [Gonium pectorale]|eukprot:KXZ44261.1 hypothetical protein GPECTOR_70g492 [Gonium pectorale]